MANNGTAPDFQSIRDEITRIYNSTEDYTQQANMQPFNSGMTRDQIASIYYDGAVPSANDIPVLQPTAQQPIQAQTPTQKQNTPTTAQKPQKDVEMERAKEIGRQAKLYAESGKLKPTERALSANEQRDMERAMNARKDAEDRRRKTVTETVKTEEQLSGQMPSEITSGTVNKRQTDTATRNVMRNQYALADAIAENTKGRNAGSVTNTNAYVTVVDEAHPDGYAVPAYMTDDNGNILPEYKDTAADSYKNQIEKINNSSTINTNETPEQKIDRYTSPDYQLSKEEKKDAKALVKDYFDNNPTAKTANNTNNANLSATLIANMSEDERNEYARMVTLQDKTSGLSSYAKGSLSSVPFLKSAEDKVAEMAGIDPKYNFSAQLQNAQTQNPLLYGAGDMTTKIAEYSTLAPALEKIPALGRATNGLGTALAGGNTAVGNAIGNVMRGTLADIALDTIPREIQNAQNGMGFADIATDAAGNIAENTLFNTIGEAAPYAWKGAKNLINGLTNKGAVDQAADAARSALNNELNPLETAAKNADIDNAINQQKQAAQNIEDLSNRLSDDEIRRINELNAEDASRDFTEEITPQDVNDITRLNEVNVYDISDEFAPTSNTQNVNEINQNAGSINPEKITADDVIPANKAGESAPEITRDPLSKSDESALNTGDKGYSRVYTNTLVKNKIVDMANNINKINAQYDIHHKSDVIDVAKNRYLKNPEFWEKAYVSGEEKIASDTDVSTAMLLLEDKAEKIRMLQEAGADKNEIAKLAQERDLLARKLRAAGAEKGQAIKAFDYFNGTADGAIINAERMYDQQAKKWANNNVKKANSLDNAASSIVEGAKNEKTSSKLSKALSDLGNDSLKANNVTERVAKTHDQIRSEVEATLRQEFSSVSEKFTPDDVEFLTNLVENNTPTWQITDELQHFLDHGQFYEITQDVIEKAEKSSKLTKILDNVVGGKQVANKAEKTPETFEQTLEKVRNTLDDEYSGVAGQFNETDYNFIAHMMQENVPSWQIEDEIRHRLNYGEWYNLDESTPVKVKKNAQLARMLDEVVNGKQVEAKAKEPETYSEFLEKIKNTLNDESLGVADQFDDADYYFIAKMIEERVPQDQIRDELLHKLRTGDWYTLDEAVDVAKPTNVKVNNALNLIDAPEVEKAVKEAPSYRDLRDEIKNTLEKEYGSIDGVFDDNDIDYIANMVETGATTKELSDMMKTKIATGIWDIPEDTVQKVNEYFESARAFGENSKQRVDFETKAFWELANCTNQKSSLADKFEAWRFLAMLGNPKTHVRNMIGNTLFSGVTSVSNSIAAAMEAGANAISKNGIDRTKAILTHKDIDLVKACGDDATENAYRQLSGSKWNDSKGVRNAIREQKEVFNSKWANAYNKSNKTALSAEDTFAMKNKYKTSLAGYLKANGIDQNVFNDEARYKNLLKESKDRLLNKDERTLLNELSDRVSTLEKGREYAIKQAEYAAFHEDNVVADWLSNISRSATGSDNKILRAFGKGFEGVLPFKKTPANILRSGFEYSPMNIIQDIIRANNIRKGTGTAAELFESMSKTLTGSMMVGIGAWMYDKGMLNLSDEDTKWQDSLEGKQNYSVTIPIGKDKEPYTFSIDFAAPSVMPIFLGAQIKKMWDANKENKPDNFFGYLSEGLQAGSKLLSPIAETSMLSGISDTLDSISSDNKLDALFNLGLTTATGYLQQGIPTVLGQAARVIDNTRRSTYSEQNDPLARTLDKRGEKILNKSPLLSMLNEPYVDAYGRQQTNSPTDTGIPTLDLLGNIAYQFLSPSYIQKVESNPADTNAWNVYNDEEAGGNANVFAGLNTSKKVGGNRLSEEDYTKYATERGNANLQIRNILANNEEFQSLSPQTQAEVLLSLDNFADKVGESFVNPDMEATNSLYKAYNNSQEYDDKGFRVNQMQAVVDKILADNNPYGLDSNTYQELKESGEDLTPYEGYGEALEQYGLTDTQANREAWKEGQDQSFAEIAEYNKAFTDAGMEKAYTSKSARMAYESGDLATYKDYREYLDKKDLTDSEKRWTDFRDGKIDTTSSLNSDIDWSSYGITNKFADEGYAKAKQEIPRLSPQLYAQHYKGIDANNNNGITQDEVIAYLNKIGADETSGNQFWNAFGASNWKKIPVLEGGTWVKSK